jgi:hypothetical protein
LAAAPQSPDQDVRGYILNAFVEPEHGGGLAGQLMGARRWTATPGSRLLVLTPRQGTAALRKARLAARRNGAELVSGHKAASLSLASPTPIGGLPSSYAACSAA